MGTGRINGPQRPRLTGISGESPATVSNEQVGAVVARNRHVRKMKIYPTAKGLVVRHGDQIRNSISGIGTLVNAVG